MMFWQLLTLSLCLVTVQGWANVQAYFNQNPHTSYTDPYRGVTRAGDNLEQVMLDQVLPAKKSIYIAVQELRLPLLAKALAPAPGAGGSEPTQ